MEKLSYLHLVEKDCSMENLNSFELEIVTRLSEKYPVLRLHIPVLRVESRESTGVGMFVNLSYEDRTDIPKLDDSLAAISTNENIHIPSLEYGLGYEVVLTHGWLELLEIITYGESWDGVYDDYSFVE
jgi:hypothetical protein